MVATGRRASADNNLFLSPNTLQTPDSVSLSHFFFFPLPQNDKKTQLEGKLKDVRFRLSAQRKEVEQTNQTRETRIAEITLLQQQLQVHTTNPSARNAAGVAAITKS